MEDDHDVLWKLWQKKHADPGKPDVAKFSVLNKIPSVKRGSGGVVCLYDNLATLHESDKAIPVTML
jgi:hypothetical protein